VTLSKIISGGQTGVDRAALDAAIAVGCEHGGSCPQGRKAEDGPIPDRYQLTELSSPIYAVRTEQNVVDADATLILHFGLVSGGTELTCRMAEKHARPCLVVDLTQPLDAGGIQTWLHENHVQCLNVAGPRESSSPGIRDAAYVLLVDVFQGS
jgi:hypothetical protein